MYRFLFRPILFFWPPEVIHRHLLAVIRFVFKIPGLRLVVRRIYQVRDPELHTEFLGLKFSSPVGLAAGFDKNAEIFEEFADFGFSHIEVGTVTPRGQSGNAKPRSFRIPADQGLINRMGFNNEGVDAMVGRLDQGKPSSLIIGGNIGKNTLTANEVAVADYETCFRKLYGYVDYFVVNVSCPNITNLHELQDQDGLESILGRLSSIRSEKKQLTPILLKISPDLNEDQINTTLDIIDKYGIDGVVATNTTIKRDGLKTDAEKISAIGKGGMSGGPLTGRSLEVVKYIADRTGGKLPIIGVGGIMTTDDALRMLDAGATLVQVYSGFIYNGPGFARRINKAILRKRRSNR